MEYKVKKSFVDKNTKVLFSKGAIYTTEKKERAEYLIEKGYLEKQSKACEPKEILKQTVAEITTEITSNTPKEVLKELLTHEENSKNRKSVIQHIEALLKSE